MGPGKGALQGKLILENIPDVVKIILTVIKPVILTVVAILT